MADNTNSFVLAGNNCYASRGCEAILRGTTAIMREVFGNAVFYSAYFHKAKCPDKLTEYDDHVIHLPIEQISLYSPAWFGYKALRGMGHPHPHYILYYQLSSYIKKSRAMVMIGGDNYSLDYGRPDAYLSLNSFAKERGKPVVLWGSSVGPFSKDSEYEKKAARELNKVDRIYVRESDSQKYLSSIGIEENVRLTADPSYWMKPEPVELNSKLEAMLKSGCVGLNLSHLVFSVINNTTEQSYAKTQELILGLAEKLPYPILLIPHSNSHDANLNRDDYLFLQNVFNRLPASAHSKVAMLEEHYDAEKTKWIISRLIAFAGARMHATFAAISSGVPAISIGYSIKSEGSNQDIYGSKEWLIRNYELTLDVLVQKMLALLSQHDQIQKYLLSVEPVFKQRALSAGIDLKNLLSSMG